MIEIFDGHNDTVQRIKEYLPNGIDFLERSGEGHLDLPRACEGGMVGGLFAMFAKPEHPPTDNIVLTEDGYRVRLADAIDPLFAKNQIAAQLDALKKLEARSAGTLRIATSGDEVEGARRDHCFAIVIHMEGADAIGPDLKDLDDLYGSGLRSLGLVWSRPNIFGEGVSFGWPSSPDTGPGLTPLGKDLVRRCNSLGVMIDVSHLNERGFWDVAAISAAPLVATHTCVHAISPSARNLTERQLNAIRDSDGIVGVNLCVNDLRPDGRRDPNTALDVVARHFAYLVDILGIDRVAIGSDFDGTMIPTAIGDASGFPHLIGALREAGFDDASLRKIGVENWIRIFDLSLKCTGSS